MWSDGEQEREMKTDEEKKVRRETKTDQDDERVNVIFLKEGSSSSVHGLDRTHTSAPGLMFRHYSTEEKLKTSRFPVKLCSLGFHQTLH